MKYKIEHITKYSYQNAVTFCHNQAILKPIDNDEQSLLEYSVKILPNETERDELVDFFGNNVLQFLVQASHTNLEVRSSAIVQKITKQKDYAQIFLSVSQAIEALEEYSQPIICAKQFLFESPLVKHDNESIKKYAEVSFDNNANVYQACLDLMRRIYEDFDFTSGATDVNTTVDQIFTDKKGVCQDFAHFAIACVRSIGLPAKYVSGYIETLPPLGEEKLIGADASHAWFCVFIPRFGWFEFDPTNNQVPNYQHIILGYGRDYSDVVPLKGIVQSSGENYLSVSVDIQRI